MTTNELENLDSLEIVILPESLAEIIENLQAKGLSEAEISEEIEKIKVLVAEDIQERAANGEDFEDSDVDFDVPTVH